LIVEQRIAVLLLEVDSLRVHGIEPVGGGSQGSQGGRAGRRSRRGEQRRARGSGSGEREVSGGGPAGKGRGARASAGATGRPVRASPSAVRAQALLHQRRLAPWQAPDADPVLGEEAGDDLVPA